VSCPSVEEAVLREVESFPSTNLTRLFRYAGRVLPETVGGGCLWMAARLARLLKERKPGIKVSHYGQGPPGSHATTVSDDGVEKFLYEPSLFQVRPFSLTRFEADARCCTSETYPKSETRPFELRFRMTESDLLRMEMLSPRGVLKRSFQYIFRTPVTVNEDDPYADLPFIEPQDQLYVYFLNPDFSKSVLMVNTRMGHISVGRVYDRLYVEYEPGFKSRFESCAERMRMTAVELRKLLNEGLEIYKSHYPDAAVNRASS
jgi:hypothetical protein